MDRTKNFGRKQVGRKLSARLYTHHEVAILRYKLLPIFKMNTQTKTHAHVYLIFHLNLKNEKSE